MNIIKRVTLLTLALALTLGLTACDSLNLGGLGKPDMPMEITMDDHTIVLGKTTTAEMAGWGWEVNFTGSQNEIREDAKYVGCYYTIRKPGGGEFTVTVWVPFQKNISGNYVDFSEEEKMSKTEGVVCLVTVRKDAAEEFEILYNGTDYHKLTWETVEEWGAKKDESSTTQKIYKMEVAQGSLKFDEGYISEDEPGRFTVSMNTGAFSKLQK